MPPTPRPPCLPTFTPHSRHRTVAVVQPGTSLLGVGAPYVAAATDLPDSSPGAATLRAADWSASAVWDGEVVAIETTDGAGRTARHFSRRHGRPPRDAPPVRVAVALTAGRVTAFTHGAAGALVARAFVDLEPGDPPVHDPAWLATLSADAGESGRFGQLGLRDVRLVTEADGSPYRPRDEPAGTHLLTATSAGPGGFTTGHASVWAIDGSGHGVRHRGDLFLRRPDAAGTGGEVGVYGDHAVHLVRDGERWLLAASTWGDFDRTRVPGVACVLAEPEPGLDPTRGTHVLDARPLVLDGLGSLAGGSVGCWDPHLARTDDGWLVAAVSARRFFEFHPVLATGPDLDHLAVRAGATHRRACEGVTLARLEGRWWVLASEGRDGRREHRASYPVMDLDLAEVGRVEAAYPTNIPWPTLVPGTDGPLLVGFDGTPAGGPLPGYGTHGDLVVQTSARSGGCGVDLQ